MVDFQALQKNSFWKKKLHQLALVRDTNNDGSISRADYEIVIDRYSKMKSKDAEKVVKFLSNLCEQYGPDTKLSFAEFEERWIEAMMKLSLDDINSTLGSLFAALDLNGDGIISFAEWKSHYVALGIPAEHAQASFAAMDSDSDGTVSKQEFIDYHFEFLCTTENKLNSGILYGPL